MNPLRGSGTCPGHSFRRDSQLSVPDWSDTRECVLYPILVSDAMIISLPCKCSCMWGCPVLFNYSWYAQASFLLLLLLVPSPLISVHLFVTEPLFPPVPLPSSPHFYIESCRWTRVGGPCADAHRRCNVRRKEASRFFFVHLLFPSVPQFTVFVHLLLSINLGALILAFGLETFMSTGVLATDP